MCRGLSSKIYVKIDATGQLIHVVLTPGQTHESQVAGGEACDYFLADKVHDIDEFRAELESAGTLPVIPSKTNRINHTEHDAYIYK